MTRRIEPPESCNVFTPASLATALVRTLKDKPKYRWLEPCVGKGAFLNALSEQSIPRNRITGIDLCKVAEPTDDKATVERGTEFLSWASTTKEKFDRVVANPPYISLSNLPPAVQNAAKAIAAPDGEGIPKAANCWYAFLCAAINLLNPGGSLGFVLPAGYEFANYAATLRKKLPSLFASVAVHRSKSPIFENVEDGSIVLIARGYRLPHRTSKYFIHEDLENLVAEVQKRKSSKPQSKKDTLSSHKGVQLSDVMTIGLGAVTGDAQYFLLTEEARKERNLPTAALVPIVSKSAHIEHSHLTARVWNDLRDAGERVWLFRPSLQLVTTPEVKAYLSLDAKYGGCRKSAYKVKIREPWFQAVLPPQVDGFISGMATVGPWICLNRKHCLSANNTLYVVQFKEKLTNAAKEAWALMMMTSRVRRQIEKVCRKYPMGLRKLEPCDLKSLRLPQPEITKGLSANLRNATRALLDGDKSGSERIANSAIKKIGWLNRR